MNIKKKRNLEASKENTQDIELFATSDEKNAKIKWLDNNGIEKIVATESYVNEKVAAIPTPTIPNLQTVLDQDNTSTTSIVINSDDGLTSSIISTVGVAGLGDIDGETPTWSFNNSNGNLITIGTISNNNGLVKPYKEYKAYITQIGTDSPDIQYFHSDFTPTITATRAGVGSYNIISIAEGIFIANKTFPDINLLSFQEGTESCCNFSRSDDSTIQLSIMDNTGTLVDGFAAFIIIQVYN